ASGAVNLLVDAFEHLFNLLIQFDSVGDDQDARVGDIFPNTFGDPDHRQTFATALGVPDDAALALTNALLSRYYAKILVVTAQLLRTRVEHRKVMYQLQQPVLVAQLQQGAVERLFDSGFFSPGQVILLARLYRSVAQALGVVSRHHQLHGCE